MRAALTILLLALAATGEHSPAGVTLDGVPSCVGPFGLGREPEGCWGRWRRYCCFNLRCSAAAPPHTAGAAADAAASATAQANAAAAGRNAVAQASLAAVGRPPHSQPAVVALISSSTFTCAVPRSAPTEPHCAATRQPSLPLQANAAATAIAGAVKPFPPLPPIKPEKPKAVPIKIAVVKSVAVEKKKKEAPEVSGQVVTCSWVSACPPPGVRQALL